MAKPTNRFQIGEFWLHYREERDDWCICWYDRSARTRRRKSTGIGGGDPNDPPVEAKQALAKHHADNARPQVAVEPTDARLSPILTMWLRQKGSKLARAEHEGYAIRHWQTFLDAERKAGRLGDTIMVADMKPAVSQRYIESRKAQGIRGETINTELSTLRRALSWALKSEIILAAPFVPSVEKKDRSGPREIEYSIEQVAALLEAAARIPERHHVLLFALIMLSTHARVEGVLELQSDQIKKGRIFFNAPGRAQTTKRRATVPISPTLAPWLRGVDGKVIRYRAMTKAIRWADPNVPEYFERDCYDLGRAFEACLLEAGISQQVKRGDALVEKGIGTPNTLRHTCHTYLQTMGVPQAQIDMAAGHSEPGSGRNYTHLRPEYLRELIAAVEEYWSQMSKLTKAHLRTHCGPKVFDMALARNPKGARI